MVVQFLLSLAICIWFIYLWFEKRKQRLPPGPIRLPLLGSVIQLHHANPTYPHLAMAKLAEKYGEIMSFGFGMHTAGIIWSHGQDWLDIRRFTMKILKEFGYGKAKMNQALTDSANQLVEGINLELSDSSNGTFVVDSHSFSVYVVNVLWNMVAGYKFDPADDILNKNMELAKNFFAIVGHGNPYNMFPFLKDWFPNQMRYPEHLETYKELHEYMKNLINDAKERRSLRLDSEPISFIEAFLDKVEMHHADAKTIFTHEQLELILEDLITAGSEITSSILNYSILFLVQIPNTQIKFRQEILDKTKNRTDILQSMELKKIPYVKATIIEILRMGNIAPIPVPRSPTRDVHFQDYIIPKGSVLFINLHPMFNEKNYWKDPENFRPERFLNECGEIEQKRAERVMNSVFGTGARVCFGETVAVDTLFIFLAALVINFEFHSIPGQEPSAENPYCGLTICPRQFCVRVTPIKI